MSEPISLLLSDHTLLWKMLRERLDREDDMNVVATASNDSEIVRGALEFGPDVVIVGLDMLGSSSLGAAGRIRARHPQTRIVILGDFASEALIAQALAADVAGCLTTSESPETVVQAIRAIASGKKYFSPEVGARIVVDSQGARLAQARDSRMSQLTPRELEVLRYIALGLPQKEIARAMFVSVSTAHFHRINLMKKLSIHNRVELARFAIREGLAVA